MTTPELTTVEQALAELQEMFPPSDKPRTVNSTAIHFRNRSIDGRVECGITLYFSVGQNNCPTWYADTLSEAMAEVRKWHREQDRQQQHEDSYFDDPLRGTNKC